MHRSHSDTASTPTVVESWRVDSGRVIAHEAHRKRFERSAVQVFGEAIAAGPLLWVGTADGGNPVEAEWGQVWADVFETVPLADSWFPRLTATTAHGALRVDFTLRPAPEKRPLTKLRAFPDERTWPTVKGPDFPQLGELRTAAQELGASDALLLDAQGAVTEAANGAVVGWLGDALVVPETDLRVESVTLGALLKQLRSGGVDIRRGTLLADPDAPPATRGWDELWYLNTLHALSPVSMLGDARLGLDVARVRRWRPRLEGTAAVPAVGRPGA